MKKLLLLVLALSVLATSGTVSAHDRNHKEKNHPRQESRWQDDRHEHERDMPFRWHERFERLAQNHHRAERIHDYEFGHRFPGLRAYRWHDDHDRGFWHTGHIIKDAVLFYNDSDELVSYGYMRDGVFIVINDDDSTHEHHDSFFLSWWNH